MTDDVFSCEIGARVVCDEHFGTVRYVGPVDGQQGIWLGIEWDDFTRGKHDGSIVGKRYFHSSHPTGASFLRPKKVDLGRDFLLAVEDKYGEFSPNDQDTDETNDDSPSHNLLVLNMKSNKAIAVDFVGGDRVAKVNSNWSALPRLALDKNRVNGINLEYHDPLKLTAFPMTTHLLLRANLLSKWTQVVEICSILPRLEDLDVSENRIAKPPADWNDGGVFKNVSSLVMHRLNYSWEEVLTVLEHFPRIKSLGLSFNIINSLACSRSIATSAVLSNLTFLDLVGNPIQSWDEILKLGFMENLNELHIDECGLTSINFPDAKPTQTTALFPTLQYLTIDFNKIDSWRSINELAKLAALQEVRLRHNPVYRLDDITQETARQLVIARLPKIKVLNGSRVWPLERRGAEIDYVTRLAKQYWEALKSNKLEDFRLDHPTYEQLIDKCNMRSDLFNDEAQADHEKPAFIDVGFVMFGSADPPIIQKVSMNVPIAKLKILAKRVMKLTKPPSALTLSYQSLKNPKLLVPLDKDSKELSFFSIENGDTIVVQF